MVPEGETVGLLSTSSPQAIRAMRGRTGIMGLAWALGKRQSSHLKGSNTTREKISTHVLYINSIRG
jgi:hypothetical protein